MCYIAVVKPRVGNYIFLLLPPFLIVCISLIDYGWVCRQTSAYISR